MPSYRAPSSAAELRFKAELERNVALFGSDSGWGVPDAARRAFSDEGIALAILGTTDFAISIASKLNGLREIVCFVDDYRDGETLTGIGVCNSVTFVRESRKRIGRLLVVNCARYDRGIRHFDALASLAGVPSVNFEQMVRLLDLGDSIDHRLADWGPLITSQLDQYLGVAEAFDDVHSRETFYAVLLSHLTCDREWRMTVCKPYSTLYFRSGLFELTSKEKFVDCGASIGESTSALIGITQAMFLRSWMIEPDRFNVERLSQLIKSYSNTPIHTKLTLIPCAIGEEPGRAPFSHIGGHGGCITASPTGSDVEIDTLSNLIDEIPTFIKMDLEGHEIPALRGAADLILKAHPKLAISAYHRASDLLDIPKVISQIDSGYRIGLRHHTEDRWDTCMYFW